MTLAGADFDALYRKHAPGAFRRARRLLGNDADAHEVVHDLFVTLLESPGQFAGRSGLTGFMYQSITHACLNRLRNQRTRLRLLNDRRVASQPDAAMTQPETLTALLSELKSMPEELATAAIYHYVDGLTHDEIATIMACSARRVGNLLARVSGWAKQGAPR